MIPAQGVTGKNVVVLGLGRSGLTAALALRAGGAEVRVKSAGRPGGPTPQAAPSGERAQRRTHTFRLSVLLRPRVLSSSHCEGTA